MSARHVNPRYDRHAEFAVAGLFGLLAVAALLSPAPFVAGLAVVLMVLDAARPDSGGWTR